MRFNDFTFGWLLAGLLWSLFAMKTETLASKCEQMD